MNAGGEKILVVDDEPQIIRVLRRGLGHYGYEVRAAPDAESAMDIYRAWAPTLVITDLAMPEIDGVELCRSIRRISRVPILILSVRGEEAIKVKALDSGADDYVTKPFSMEELLARIRALLRRVVKPEAAPGQAFEAGDFKADPVQHKISVQGRELHLTPKEYDLLLFLLLHRDRVLTHRAILSEVWGSNSTEQSEYLRVFIAQLRKKIERNPASPRYIKTEPWIGYRFEAGE